MNISGEVLLATWSKNLILNLVRQFAQKFKKHTKFSYVSVSIGFLDHAYIVFLKDWEILQVKLVLSMISSLLSEISRLTLKNSNV